MTISELKTGTVITYNDMANSDLQKIVLDSYEDRFGKWVNVIDKENDNIEPMAASTKIGERWTIIKAA